MSYQNPYQRGFGDSSWLTDALTQGLNQGIIAGGYKASVPAGLPFIYSTQATLNWSELLPSPAQARILPTGEATIRQRIYAYLGARGYSNLNVAFTEGWTEGAIKITGKTVLPRISGNDILRDCVAAIASAGGSAGHSTIAVGTNIPGQYVGTQPIPGQYDEGIGTGHNFFDFLNPLKWDTSTLLMVSVGLAVVLYLRD